MENIEKLNAKYYELKSLEDTDKGIFVFKKLLLETDDIEVLDFHYKILNDRSNPYLNRDIFCFFSDRKDTKKVSNYLFEKYNEVSDLQLKVDLIQLLGHLRSEYAKKLAYENIKNEEPKLRDVSVTVLGWVGKKADLKILNERMINDPDGDVRSSAVSAMLQLWFESPSFKTDILNYIHQAIKIETDEEALQSMVITVQDLCKKKLGLKNNINEGTITGDIPKAKENALKLLNTMFGKK